MRNQHADSSVKGMKLTVADIMTHESQIFNCSLKPQLLKKVLHLKRTLHIETPEKALNVSECCRYF